MVGHCAVDFPEVYYLDLFNDCGIISLDTLLVYISNSSYMLLSPQQGKKWWARERRGSVSTSEDTSEDLLGVPEGDI